MFLVLCILVSGTGLAFNTGHFSPEHRLARQISVVLIRERSFLLVLGLCYSLKLVKPTFLLLHQQCGVDDRNRSLVRVLLKMH
jgi:hypothetical protein